MDKKVNRGRMYISEILNDCTKLCVPTYKNEPLSSILAKICKKAEDCCEGGSVFIEEGDNITITGSGTEADPFVVSSSFSEFSLEVEDSPSIEMYGGTTNTPLSADVILSPDYGNILEVRGNGLYATGPLVGVIYGGIVTWLSDYTYHISAAGYYINGVFYEAPEEYITLSAPDDTYNRIDTFIANTSGQITVVEGTPSSDPAQAPIDPATQLQLSFALVETGTTQPTITQECIFSGDTPTWAQTTSNVLRINPESTNSPCDPTIGIEGTSLTTGNNLLLTRTSSFTPASQYSVLTMLIRSKGTWSSNQSLEFQWELSGADVGYPVTLTHDTYNFDSSNTSDCQVVTIPIFNFGLNSTDVVDSLRITTITDVAITGFYMDNICLQNQPLPPSPDTDEKVKVSGTDTTSGYLFDKIIAGDGISLAIDDQGSDEKLEISSSLVFENGLTETDGVVELGGSLLKNTVISSNTYKLLVTGSVSDYSLEVVNNASGIVAAIRGYAPDASATGISGSGGNVGVSGQSTSGAGVRASATTGYGISASATTGEAGLFQITPTTTNDVKSVATFQRFVSGTATDNIGMQINLGVATTSGSAPNASKIVTGWTDATHASRDGYFSIYVTDNTSEEEKFKINSTGQITLPDYGDGTFTGSTTYALAVDASGNIIETSFPATITASNGLTKSSNNIKLGGTLVEDTTINGGSYYISLSSSSTTSTLSITNSGSVNALYVQSTLGALNNAAIRGLTNASSFGGAIEGIASSGASGLSGTSNSGAGITATSTSGVGGEFNINPSSTNTVANIITLTRTSSGTPANGIGTAVQFNNETATSGTGVISNRIISKWSDATHATRTSQFIIEGVDSTTTIEQLIINGDGSIQLPTYGEAAHTGTAAYLLAVDEDGNIIEEALGGGSMTNPMGAAGDIIYSEDGSGTPAALAIGTAGQVLAVNGTADGIEWITPVGTGSVLSVDLSGSDFSFSGGPITTSGTINITLATVNSDVGSFGSSTAIPTLTVNGKGLITAVTTNAVVAPAGTLTGTTLASNVVTSSLTSVGTITTGVWQGTAIGAIYGGTGQTSWSAGQLLYASASNTLSKLNIGTAGQVLRVNAGGTAPEWATLSGSGTVTSVNASGGTTGFSFSGGPITGSGTLAMSGILLAEHGGTGQSSYTVGDILYANTTTTLDRLAAVATGSVLISAGTSTAPEWGKVDLSVHVTGDLPLSNIAQGPAVSILGVTGNSTADYAPIQGLANQVLRINSTGSGVLFGSIDLSQSATVGSSVLAVVNGGTGQSSYTNGQLLIGRTSDGSLVKGTLTAGSGMTITNGAGSITVASSFNPTRQTLTDDSTITWNINNGEAAVVTLGNTGRTLTITNPVAGRTYVIEVKQDASGNRTITTWPTGTLWEGGSTPTLSTAANKIDVFTFYYNGTNFLGKKVGTYN